jgi:mono/diheme cytochrome c family protein
MLRKLVVPVIILAAIAGAVFWFVTIPATVPASALSAYTPNVENGRAMFFAGGCASCHMSTGQDDKTRLGGGFAMKTPFGTLIAPNISPDPKDGIGGWTEANFVTALWQGTSPDGRHYYPAFPYTSYQRMTASDARDLFAYLKTLPPVAGKAAANQMRFPFNLRRTLGVWKLLYLDGEKFTPDPNRPAEWNRGAYLVNGPGHCAECHSPRTLLGGIVEDKRFAGGPEPTGDGWVPNITPAGIGSWSEADIARLLTSGDTPSGDTVGADMGKVVGNTSQLSEKDRAAIAMYVKSLPPVEGPKPPPSK